MPEPLPKGSRPRRPATPPAPDPSPAAPARPRPAPPSPSVALDVSPGVAVASAAEGGTVTARRAGGLRDMNLDVKPGRVGVGAALQNLAKAVNIAFQTDFGENDLESVYQAAIVRRGEVHIIHREYFGFGDSWFGQFGRLLRSLGLSFQGPDPVSPEGRQRIAERGPSTIRGLFNVIARKMDLVSEYEDRVPAYLEVAFDRLEASGIIEGWDRDDWIITTTRVGLDIRVTPRPAGGEAPGPSRKK